MLETKTSRNSTLDHVYLIISMFVVLIILLACINQVQMNTLLAVRAYVGAEGLWAKAQKDAIRSIEHYAITHNESDFQAYEHFIKVPLGDYKSRIELQKLNPDAEIVRQGFLEGGNHADDIDYMIKLFTRFEHFSFMSEAIQHWTQADLIINELNAEAINLHKSISAGHENKDMLGPLISRLDSINQNLTEQENQFSFTLGVASRWASDVSRVLTYIFA